MPSNYLEATGFKQQSSVPQAFGKTGTEQVIKNIVSPTQETPKAPEALTKEQFFQKVDNAIKSGDFIGQSDEQIYNGLLESVYKRGASVTGLTPPSAIKQVEEVEMDQEENIAGLDVGVKAGEDIREFGQSLKPFTGEDLDTTYNEEDNAFQRNAKLFTNALKGIANIPGDTVQLAGDLLGLVSNPVGTTTGLLDIGEGISDKIVYTALNKMTGQDVDDTDKAELVETIGTKLGEIATNPEELQRLTLENPTDVLMSIEGGISLAKGKVLIKLEDAKKINDTAKIEKYTKLADNLGNYQDALNPITLQKDAIKSAGAVTKGIVKTPVSIGKTLTSKLSGIAPESLGTIFKNPDLFKKAKQGNLTREGVAEKVVKSIDQRINEVSGIGKGYQKIIKGDVVSNGDEVLSAVYKGIDKFKSKNLTKADQSLLDDAIAYIDRYKGDITDTDLISLRQQLDSLKYDASGNTRKLSQKGNLILQEIRKGVDDLAGEKINGLKELDVKYASEITELKKVKDLIFDRNGTLKDNYIQTVSNLLGKGKELKLERIKKLVPEIEDEINAIKAFADVELAKGKNVGAYAQGGSIALGISGTIDPITAGALLLITNPTVVSSLVQGLGYSAKIVGSITNKVKNGVKLSKSEAKIVSEAIKNELKETGANMADDLIKTTNE